MAYYQTKSGKWGIDYYTPNGRRKRELVGSKELAKRVWIKRQDEMARGVYLENDKGKGLTLDQLFQEYLNTYAKQNKRSWKKDEQLYKTIGLHLGNFLISQIEPSIIEKYRTQRMQIDKIKQSSMNRETALLRCMFNKAIEYGFYHKMNPLKRVKQYREDNSRVRFFSEDEYQRFFKVCASNKILHDMCLVAVQTGMRAGELRAMKKEHVNFISNTIYVPESKSGKGRYIPMTSKVKEILSLPFNFNYCYNKTFAQALRIAGIEKFTFHSLRHSYASYLAMGGVDLNTIRELLGHSDIKMTLRYAHLGENHKTNAIKCLENLSANQKMLEMPSA